MKIIGIALWAGGIFLVAYAMFVFDTSLSYGGYQRVVNLDLQQRQLMMAIMGGLMFLGGVILHALALFLPARTVVNSKAEPLRSDKQHGQAKRDGRDGPSDIDLAAQEESTRMFVASLGESMKRMRD